MSMFDSVLKKGFWQSLFTGPANSGRVKYTFDELRNLYDVLIKNQVVTEGNKALVVETIRSVAEFMIWGDQNEPRIFDFFLENNVMVYLQRVLQQPANRTGDVAKQVLQTLSIIIQNVRSETGIYFLFSNNHINNIIEIRFDFEDEEVLGFYISFLKTISLKLNHRTVQFFLDSRDSTTTFPLYTEAIKFAHHKEGMVRAGVRTLTLNVYSVDDAYIDEFVTTPPATNYFADVSAYVTEQIKILDRRMLAAEAFSPQVLSSLDSQIAEVEDMTSYISDILATAPARLSHLVAQQLWVSLIGPVLLKPLLEFVEASNQPQPAHPLVTREPGGSGNTSPRAASVRPVCCLYVLERMFQVLNYPPLLHNIAIALLDPRPAQPSCRPAVVALLRTGDHKLVPWVLRCMVALLQNRHVAPEVLALLGLPLRSRMADTRMACSEGACGACRLAGCLDPSADPALQLVGTSSSDGGVPPLSVACSAGSATFTYYVAWTKLDGRGLGMAKRGYSDDEESGSQAASQVVSASAGGDVTDTVAASEQDLGRESVVGGSEMGALVSIAGDTGTGPEPDPELPTVVSINTATHLVYTTAPAEATGRSAAQPAAAAATDVAFPKSAEDAAAAPLPPAAPAPPAPPPEPPLVDLLELGEEEAAAQAEQPAGMPPDAAAAGGGHGAGATAAAAVARDAAATDECTAHIVESLLDDVLVATVAETRHQIAEEQHEAPIAVPLVAKNDSAEPAAPVGGSLAALQLLGLDDSLLPTGSSSGGSTQASVSAPAVPPAAAAAVPAPAPAPVPPPAPPASVDDLLGMGPGPAQAVPPPAEASGQDVLPAGPAPATAVAVSEQSPLTLAASSSSAGDLLDAEPAAAAAATVPVPSLPAPTGSGTAVDLLDLDILVQPAAPTAAAPSSQSPAPAAQPRQPVEPVQAPQLDVPAPAWAPAAPAPPAVAPTAAAVDPFADLLGPPSAAAAAAPESADPLLDLSPLEAQPASVADAVPAAEAAAAIAAAAAPDAAAAAVSAAAAPPLTDDPLLGELLEMLPGAAKAVAAAAAVKAAAAANALIDPLGALAQQSPRGDSDAQAETGAAGPAAAAAAEHAGAEAAAAPLEEPKPLPPPCLQHVRPAVLSCSTELLDCLVSLLLVPLMPIPGLWNLGFLLKQLLPRYDDEELQQQQPAGLASPASPARALGDTHWACCLTDAQRGAMHRAAAVAAGGVLDEVGSMWADAICALICLEWPLAYEGMSRPHLRASSDTLLSGPHLYPSKRSAGSDHHHHSHHHHGSHQHLSSSAMSALSTYHAVQRLVALLHIHAILRRGASSRDPPLLVPVGALDVRPYDVVEGQEVELQASSAIPCIVSFAPGQERRMYFATSGTALGRLAELLQDPMALQQDADALVAVLHSSPAVLLADPAPTRLHAGIALSVAPLLGCDPTQDPKVAKWLHVHVRPSVRGLLRLLRGSTGRKGGLLAALRQLADGHWVLAFPDAERAGNARMMVEQASHRLRALYVELLSPVVSDGLD